MPIHRIARGHIPLFDKDLDFSGQDVLEGYLRVGPEIGKHDPRSTTSSTHVWLPVDVHDSHVAYYKKVTSRFGEESPLAFFGTVELLGEVFETEGFHFRSGRLAGSIVLPSVLDIIRVQEQG